MKFVTSHKENRYYLLYFTKHNQEVVLLLYQYTGLFSNITIKYEFGNNKVLISYRMPIDKEMFSQYDKKRGMYELTDEEAFNHIQFEEIINGI